jgi:hypothetical protein
MKLNVDPQTGEVTMTLLQAERNVFVKAANQAAAYAKVRAIDGLQEKCKAVTDSLQDLLSLLPKEPDEEGAEGETPLSPSKPAPTGAASPSVAGSGKQAVAGGKAPSGGTGSGGGTTAAKPVAKDAGGSKAAATQVVKSGAKAVPAPVVEEEAEESIEGEADLRDTNEPNDEETEGFDDEEGGFEEVDDDEAADDSDEAGVEGEEESEEVEEEVAPPPPPKPAARKPMPQRLKGETIAEYAARCKQS